MTKSTEPKPDEEIETLKAPPTLTGKMPLVDKKAASKVSLKMRADDILVCFSNQSSRHPRERETIHTPSACRSELTLPEPLLPSFCTAFTFIVQPPSYHTLRSMPSTWKDSRQLVVVVVAH